MTNYVDTSECEHGYPRDAVTKSGIPKCAICRRRAMYQLRTTKKAPSKPKAVQGRLDVAALAAHDTTLIGEDSPA
jgi:hypothetical protein